MYGGNGADLLYDPGGRLMLVQRPGITHVRLDMLGDGQQLITELDSSHNVLRRYAHGPGIDEPIVWYEGSGTSDRRFLHADERGSVVAVSNGSGSVTSVNSYDDYGCPASGNAGRFQYTGHMADAHQTTIRDSLRQKRLDLATMGGEGRRDRGVG